MVESSSKELESGTKDSKQGSQSRSAKVKGNLH